MKIIGIKRTLSWVLILPFLLSTAYSSGTLSVRNAWIREAPPNAMALAGYMVIENSGAQARELISAKSPVFNTIELHRSQMSGGVARMVPQQSIPVAARGQVQLMPGDYHMMLMNPTQPLKAGDTVDVNLTFDRGEMLSVKLEVKKGQGEDHHHHEHPNQ